MQNLCDSGNAALAIAYCDAYGALQSTEYTEDPDVGDIHYRHRKPGRLYEHRRWQLPDDNWFGVTRVANGPETGLYLGWSRPKGDIVREWLADTGKNPDDAQIYINMLQGMDTLLAKELLA